MDDIIAILMLMVFVAMNGALCLALPLEWFSALVAGGYLAFYWWRNK